MNTRTPTKTRMSFMTDKKKSLQKLACATDRSSSYIINKALEQYLSLYNWQTEHIQQAVGSADKGEFVKGDWRKTIRSVSA